MAIGSPQIMVRQLRQVVQRREIGALSDGQLLECFVAEHDEAAFAGLVRRHGPMVWGVCRRVVGHAQDAEDAFQATFLVLVRKAASVRPREQVGNWLYGVAQRTAMKCKMMTSRRRSREKQIPDVADTRRDAPAADWAPFLDRELSRLPEKYRVPIVLCDLEGRTRRDVARQLKLPDGTLSNRLAAGRRMLARRLTRQGVTLSAGGLAAALLAESAAARVPRSLLRAAIQLATESTTPTAVSTSVSTLTEGVLKAMLLNKLKLTMAALSVIGSMCIGAGILITPRAVADGPATPASKDAVRPLTDHDRLQGAWILTAAVVDGKRAAAEAIKKEGEHWIFVGDRFLILRADRPGRVTEAGFLIDAKRAPKTFDYVPSEGPDRGKICPGIFRLDDDVLVVCDDSVTKTRPGKFESRADAGRLLIFRRAHPGQVPLLSDADFLKRACNDLRGSPATHLEQRYFAADKDGHKRAKAVAWLLHAAADANAANALTYQSYLSLGLDYSSPAILPYVEVGYAPSRLYLATQLYDLNSTLRPGLLEERVNMNTIDSVALARLYANDSFWRTNVIDSAGIDDATFLRRTMLDMFGVLPTSLELQYFVADTDAKKREKVIGWLSETPGYAARLRLYYQRVNQLQPSLLHPYQMNQIQPSLLHHYASRIANAPAATQHASNRFQQLLTQLLEKKKTDDQVLEALTLATAARLPTESERSFVLAQVARRPDRRAAWEDVLHTLRNTKEAKDHAGSLNQAPEKK